MIQSYWADVRCDICGNRMLVTGKSAPDGGGIDEKIKTSGWDYVENSNDRKLACNHCLNSSIQGEIRKNAKASYEDVFGSLEE